MSALGKPQLVVSNDLPDPPYPADIRARGWPFDIDCERVEQSATWTLAPAELRPWLLMLWVKAWQQAPCGSLPGDDDVLAATLGMPVVMLQSHRQTLLRGWVRHKDGRLYHRVVTDMVFTMMGKRRRDRERKSLAHKHSDGFQRIPTDSTAASASASASATEGQVAANAATPTPAINEKTEKQRATRLPDDWCIPDDWLDWAVAVTKLDRAKLVRTSIVFRNFWTAKAGRDATKMNWKRTWENWVLKDTGNA